MSRISVGHQVYVVAWPDPPIIKAGYSEHSRWRDFEIRGATLLLLVPFDTLTAAFAAETLLDSILAAYGTRAFTERSAATPYLGGRGAGYLECFRYDPAMLGAMLAHMRRIVAEQCPSTCNIDARAMPPPHARTYVRTN